MYKKFFLSFIKININNLNQRIDNFLFSKIKSLSKSKIYSLIRKGNIRVNNKRISYKYKLNINDILRIPLISFNKNIKNIFLSKKIVNKFKNRIIYEDKYLILINKISGISVHSGKNIYWNLINIYRNLNIKYKYLNLIHRLDKYSSGFLLLSKKRNILIKLNNDFKLHNIRKKYILLVYGYWSKNIKKISNFLVKYNNRGYVYKYKKNNFSKFKKAITYFKIINYIGNFTLLEAEPITGRFHQIRLHTSFLGFPILFDNIYGNKYINNKFYIYKVSRLFLHCNFISFLHPILNKRLNFFLKLDDDLCYILYNIKYKFKNYRYINGSSKK